MYDLLESKQIDHYINFKLSGKLKVNSSVSDYSTGAGLLFNNHTQLYSYLRQRVTTFNTKDQAHFFKYSVFTRSIRARISLSMLVSAIVTILLQVYVTRFNGDLHKAMRDGEEVYKLNYEG